MNLTLNNIFFFEYSPHPQQTLGWRFDTKYSIGGGSIGGLLGHSPYKTARDHLSILCGPLSPSIVGMPLSHGNLTESLSRQFCAHATNCTIFELGSYKKFKDRHYSPDGIILAPTRNNIIKKILLEFKAPYFRQINPNIPIPILYYDQLQLSMYLDASIAFAYYQELEFMPTLADKIIDVPLNRRRKTLPLLLARAHAYFHCSILPLDEMFDLADEHCYKTQIWDNVELIGTWQIHMFDEGHAFCKKIQHILESRILLGTEPNFYAQTAFKKINCKISFVITSARCEIIERDLTWQANNHQKIEILRETLSRRDAT